MNLTTREGLPYRAVDWSVSLYSVFLVLYPVSYRREYGPHMIQLFRDLARDASNRGGAAELAHWWMMAMLDLLTSALEERRRTPLRLTRRALQQGLLLCLFAGGVCFAIAAFSQLQPYTHYAFRGAYAAALSLIYPSFILLALGSAGLAWSLWSKASPLARLMLGATCAGMSIVCAAMLAGVLIPGDEDWAWHAMMIGLAAHFAGLGLFGLISLRAHLLPRWSFVPLLMSLGYLTLWLVDRDGDVYGPQWGMFLMFASIGLGYVLIWLSLWRAPKRTIAA